MGNDGLTLDEIDAASRALDRLEFVAMSLANDSQTRWNVRADNGLCSTMRDALDTLGGLVAALERTARHDGDVTIIEGSELLRT